MSRQARAASPRPALVVALFLAACSPASPPVAHVEPEPQPPVATAPTEARAARPVSEPVADDGHAKVHEMLRRVSRARGLPVRHEVASRVLDRAGILARIRAHVEKEVPREAVESEGELLTLLELLPPDYDFVEGTYALIQGRIAGFYEPSDETMYMVDDLGDDEATETLAHELDHALQDQSFSLAPMLEYRPGDGDRSAAEHAVIEGDATSATLDIVAGSAFDVSEGALRTVLALSNAASGVAATPHVLQTSLTAPYADGFAFVQRERRIGGWAAVDAALRAPLASTEQLLHADKYAQREPPIAVPVPTFASIGEGFRAVDDDVMGEQGLRLMLEEWTNGAIAEKGAAGWGGDRYVIVHRDDAGTRAVAMGWHAVMDTERDAAELAEILAARFGHKCRERATVGPLAWRRLGRDVVLAAGPYQRAGKEPRSAGTCRAAERWLVEMLQKKR